MRSCSAAGSSPRLAASRSPVAPPGAVSARRAFAARANPSRCNSPRRRRDALGFRGRGGCSQQRLDRLGLLSQHVFAQRSTFAAAHGTQEWQARRRRLDALGQRAAGAVGQRPQRGRRVVAGGCGRRRQQPQAGHQQGARQCLRAVHAGAVAVCRHPEVGPPAALRRPAERTEHRPVPPDSACIVGSGELAAYRGFRLAAPIGLVHRLLPGYQCGRAAAAPPERWPGKGTGSPAGWRLECGNAIIEDGLEQATWPVQTTRRQGAARILGRAIRHGVRFTSSRHPVRRWQS
jgi:hypothetical protein